MRILLRIAVGVFVLVLAACALVVGNSYLAYRRSVTVFEVLKSIEPGETREAELDSLFKRNLLARNSNCVPANCEYRFMFGNLWIARLRPHQSRWFAGTIDVSNGIVTSWYAGLACNAGKPGIHIVQHACRDCMERYICRDCISISKTYNAGYNVSGSGGSNMAHVDLARNATAEERQKAFDINLRMLYRFGKIPSGRELAPSVWQDHPEWP